MASRWTIPLLEGRHVRLEPLRLDHAAALRAAAGDGELWALRYTSVPGPAPGEAERYVEDALAACDVGAALPFVVIDAQGDVAGSTRFYDIDRSVPRVKLGYTWYARRVQRTALNTEAKRLLIDHAFLQWHCEAVVLETSHENIQSQTAIARLGAKCDGVLRANMRHRDGSLRDTFVYSILASEWPELRRSLDTRLQENAV